MDLAEELQCNICLDLPGDPVVTECNHIYCKACINKVENKAECPVCRKDPGSILPAPHFVRNSIDILAQISQGKEKNKEEKSNARRKSVRKESQLAL